MLDVVQEITDFNQGRDPERLRRKYARMSESPFVFLRGTCHLFYRRLPRSAQLRAAPLVWACGDMHLENFGSYRGDNGQVYFDINDFDEALRAPASWDLVRLLGSVMAARAVLGVDKRAARALCKHVIETYAKALAEGKARWVERETASSPVRGLLQHADANHHDELLRSRTAERGGDRKIKLSPTRALRASDEDKKDVRALFKRLAREQEQWERARVLDVARRVAGTGSLGLERFVILVENKQSPEREHLLDLKIATAPAAIGHGPALPTQPAFADDAVRIVSVQRRIQAIAMASLQAVTLRDKPFVLRRLLPSEDRVDLGSLAKRAKLENLLSTVSECLAWDQLRSSGRDGAAIADELIAYGKDQTWQAGLLALALDLSEQNERDYDTYARAYAKGAFTTDSQSADR